MALRTARIQRVRGRPPLLAAGSTSLIHSHSSSVRSLGYVFSFIYPCYTTHEDFSDRLSEPVQVFELSGDSPLRRRLQAAAARGLTRFVGRQPELEAVRQARQRVAAGHGQVMAVVGDAGVGKSRLVYEYVHAQDTLGWRVLESASVSYGKATPYFPVIDLLKCYAQIEDADAPRTRRARLTGQVLTLDEALQDTLPPLLALPAGPPQGTPLC